MRLTGIRLDGGAVIPADAAFVASACGASSELPGAVGCVPMPGKPYLFRTTANGRTGVPGVYVAGDVSRNAQLVMVADVEMFNARQRIINDTKTPAEERAAKVEEAIKRGTRCAIAADRFLRRSDLKRRDRPPRAAEAMVSGGKRPRRRRAAAS